MKVAVRLVSGGFAIAAVWRAAVVVNVAELLCDSWKEPFVNVTGREIRLAEIRVFVTVVQVELEGLGHLVV